MCYTGAKQANPKHLIGGTKEPRRRPGAEGARKEGSGACQS